MSMGFLNPGDKPLVWRGPMLHSVIQQFSCAAWIGANLDYLVIDLPPGTGDVQLSLIQTAPITGAIVVTTALRRIARRRAKAVSMFRQVKVPLLGIIENMSYLTCPHCKERIDVFQPRRRPANGGADASAFSGELAARPARAHRRRHRKTGALETGRQEPFLALAAQQR